MPLHKSDIPPMAKAKADFNHFFIRPSVCYTCLPKVFTFGITKTYDITFGVVKGKENGGRGPDLLPGYR